MTTLSPTRDLTPPRLPDPALDALTAALAALPGAVGPFRKGASLWLDLARFEPEAVAALIAQQGLRFLTITATAKATGGETEIRHHLTDEKRVITLRTLTRNGALPSLTPLMPVASWAEREIHDLFAVDFLGHPDPAPLFRPPGFTPGFFRPGASGTPTARAKLSKA
jgi:NADH-quinone oxidoreductase subunit C